MKDNIVFLLFLLNGFLACASDTIQARKLIEKADSFYRKGTPEGDSLALLYYSQGISIYTSHQIQNLLLAKAYLSSAEIYTLYQQYKNAIPNYRNFIRLPKRKSDVSLVEAYRLLGEAYYFTFQYDSSLISLQNADNLVSKLSDYPKHIRIVNTIGLIYHTRGKYTESISYFRRASQLSNDPASLLAIYSNIADAYRSVKFGNLTLGRA